MSGRTFRYKNTFKYRPVIVKDDEEDEFDEAEEESVYYSLCEDDRVGVERMLREGLNPNYKFNGENQLGKTALHLCCEKGLEDCAKLFLAEHARVNVIDGWHQTPLMYAVCTERLDMVRMMVEAGADLDKRDRFGKAALHFTVFHETTECMQALLDGGADVDVRDSLGRTPLWVAATEDGHEQALKCLLENNAAIYIRDVREKRTPLQAALAHTAKDTFTYLHLLLGAGAYVNTLDEFGHTCIMTLIKRCYTEDRDFTDADKRKVNILLQADHDIDMLCQVNIPGLWYQFHDTALNLAIIRNLPVATQFLLDVGADPDKHGVYSMKNRKAVPPLITAVQENRLDLTKMLLQANCNMAITFPDPTDNTKTLTAFRYALHLEHWQLLELFLQAGYDLKPETYLRTNEDVPDQLVLNLEFWSRLIEHLANPFSLLVLSRQRVRKVLGQKLPQKVKTLPLPTFLMDLLLLKHL